ncbi:GDP-mannose 4,6-dehydratase [Camelimonas sp. ID_303_24]
MTIRVVAVTGASGFVGEWTMRRLANIDGIRVIPFFEPGKPRLTDRSYVNHRMQEIRPFSVIHLAAIAAQSEVSQDLRQAFDVNLTGTLNLAESIIRHSPGTRLIFSGTSECYGRSFGRSGVPILEGAALEPNSLYGVTKASADILLGQMAATGLDVVRFRPFNHTGPGQSEAYVIASFARQIARIEYGLQPPVIDVGNLGARRDFLDVRDVVEAYVCAATRQQPLPIGIALNLASGEARRIGDILDDLCAMSASRITVRQDVGRMRAGDTPLATGDSHLALKYLGWRPAIKWSDTLRDVLEFWRAKITTMS